METIYLYEGSDELEIHLILDESPGELSRMTAGTGHLYLRVADVDEMFKEVSSRGVSASRGIEMMSWGLRNFQLTDPNGNVLSVEEERSE